MGPATGPSDRIGGATMAKKKAKKKKKKK